MLNKKEFNFFKKGLLNHKIITVEYNSNSGREFEFGDWDYENLHGDIEGVNFILDDKQQWFVYYTQLRLSFGLWFKKGNLDASIYNNLDKFDVSTDFHWQERLNKKIIDVKSYSEICSVASNEITKVTCKCINDIEIIFENNLKVYISSSEYIENKDKLVSQCDEITVTFQEKDAKKYHIIKKEKTKKTGSPKNK